MNSHEIHVSTPDPNSRERGSALLLTLLVAVVLVFLGMGLLLQTSLGLEAAGGRPTVEGRDYAHTGPSCQRRPGRNPPRVSGGLVARWPPRHRTLQ